MVSYLCDISEGEDMSGVRHESIFSRRCIQCVVSSEPFGSKEGGTKLDMKVTLQTM